MAKQTKKTDADHPAETTMQELQDAGLGPLAWMGTAWLDAMSKWNGELASFVADRIREDVRTQHELLHCKSVTEMQTVQAAFLERAYVQYTVETGKLLDMGSTLFPQLTTKTKGTPL